VTFQRIRFPWGWALAVFAVCGCGKGVFTGSYGQANFLICDEFDEQAGPVGIFAGYQDLDTLMSHGTVIVVAAEDGLKILGKEFSFREIVLIDKQNDSLQARLATPQDNIVLKQPVRLYDLRLPEGPLTIPPDAKVDEWNETE
jgi:hypothetical protein